MMNSLIKLGTYQLDKDNYVLIHYSIKTGAGIKKQFEILCSTCNKVYIAKLGDERKKKNKWHCRSCCCKIAWKDPIYREKLAVGNTPALSELRRKQRSKSSLEMWNDPIKKLEISKKLRARDSKVYSKGKSKMRNSKILIHWKTFESLICVGSYESAFVEWCNINKIDFDWQIAHKMPDGRTYIVDAFIKTGQYAGKWIEIKGYMYKIGKLKWEWFNSLNPDSSLLWTKPVLQELKII